MDIITDDSNGESLDFVMKRSLLAKNKLAFILTDPDGLVRFCCVECSAKYDDKEELERHLLVHNKEYRFLCGICGTGLKRKEHLDRHTMEHQEVRPHVCSHCGKAFKRKEHLNIHKSIHSGDKSESCPVCDKSFYRRDHLRKHLQTHTKVFLERKSDNDLSYLDIKQDPADMEEDPQEEILDEAIVAEEVPVPQSNSNRPFECCICQKSYKRKDHLKIHSWTHKKKDHICSECGKGFHLEHQLLAHMNFHLPPHSADDTHILGDYLQIDETYSPDNGLLVLDKQSRYNSESRPHECEVCHRRFKRRQHLKVHMNVHSKDQPTIWCNMCGEGFILNQDFTSHPCMVAIKEEDCSEAEEDTRALAAPSGAARDQPKDAKKENKYPAEFVDVSALAAPDAGERPAPRGERPAPRGERERERAAPRAERERAAPRAERERAALRAERERALPTPQRVFVCKYCGKPFRRKDHYKIHLHIHTGVKSFFCPDCGKGFYRKDHLQKHVLVHMKMRPQKEKKKEIPALYPIQMFRKKEVKPEITIHAPSNAKLRVPLQIKVPYQVVMSTDSGEQTAVTIDPQAMETVS